MRGFSPSDFNDSETYYIHKDNLDRAYSTADRLLDVWDGMTKFFKRHPGMYFEFQRLLHDSAQVGYEAGIGKQHRTIDYDIVPENLTDKTKCSFCENGYLSYNCEQRCSRKEKGLDCELEVREYFE